MRPMRWADFVAAFVLFGIAGFASYSGFVMAEDSVNPAEYNSMFFFGFIAGVGVAVGLKHLLDYVEGGDLA